MVKSVIIVVEWKIESRSSRRTDGDISSGRNSVEGMSVGIDVSISSTERQEE